MSNRLTEARCEEICMNAVHKEYAGINGDGNEDVCQLLNEITALKRERDLAKEQLAESQSRVASAFEAAAASIRARAAQWASEGPCATPASIDINAELRNEAVTVLAMTPRAADLSLKLKVARAVAEEAKDWKSHRPDDGFYQRRLKEAQAHVTKIEAELAQEVGGNERK